MNLKILLVNLIFVTLAVSRRWDSIVESYYPKRCFSTDIYGLKHTRQGANSYSVALSDLNECISQGDRLQSIMHEIDERCNRENFQSPSLRIFFTSKQSLEVQKISRNSKATLLTTKILQNKMTSCGQMTPNDFMTFLEANKFKTSRVPYLRPYCQQLTRYRTFDGTCNNLDRPLWGSANTPFTRIAPTDYQDGIYSMPVAKSGNPLPSTRKLSTDLFSDRPVPGHVLNQIAVQWGQFITHDMTLRSMEQTAKGGIQCCSSDGSRILPEHEAHSACAAIEVPYDDYFYSHHGIRCLNYVRSATATAIDGSLGPAQQINVVSSFLDGSPVYSSNPTTAKTLRKYYGGELRLTEQGMLPSSYNVQANCDGKLGCACFMAGDSRINQTPLLASLHTILVREHNRIAKILHQLNTHWTDEIIFQEARRIVVGQIQHITYQEWLPLCLGKDYVRQNKIAPVGLFSYDYDEKINPGVINSFAAGAFRFFHTLISDRFDVCNPNYEINKFRLSDHFFKPSILEAHDNLDGIVRGASLQSAMEADNCFTCEITNFLFKSLNQTGIDLAAMDTQRGRDHGLAKYNTFRTICGLKKANNFDDLEGEMTKSRIALLKTLYEHVDDIDLFIGGMMESDIYGSLLGPTFQCIIGEQFYRSRTGDRYFYDIGDTQHSFTIDQMREIKKASMARLLCNNSNCKKIQKRAFETIQNHNPLYDCSDFQNIPAIDLEKWKQF